MSTNDPNAESDTNSGPSRTRLWFWYVSVCIAAGLGILVAIQRLGPPAAGSHPWVGSILPEVTLDPLVQAEEPLPLEDLRGKVTLVNFWGPWCGYCIHEFPHLLQIRRKHADNPDFYLLSVSSDGSWTPGLLPGYSENVDRLKTDSREIVTHFHTDLPIYVDTHGGLRNELSARGTWRGYPTTVLVDREGRIVSVWEGAAMDPKPMARRVEEVLAAE